MRSTPTDAAPRNNAGVDVGLSALKGLSREREAQEFHILRMRIIVDGYNLIRQWPELAMLDLADLQEGRDALLRELQE